MKSSTPRFPNLVIIGAMKCATTSLHYYLSLHPDIQMSQPKELRFFLSEENYAKGLDWYASHFRKPALVHGEATPGYAYFPFFSGVAERMARTIPDAKLIYMVRDPIDRVISHYIHDVAAGFEARSLQAALSNWEENPYLLVSRYSFQLGQFLKRYPLRQIKVLCMEDLKTERVRTMRTAFNYLGVDEAFHTPRFHLRFHQTRFKRRGEEENRLRRVSVQKIIQGLPVELRGLIERILALPVTRKIEMPELDGKLRERLGNYFSPDIESLRRVTGETFSSFRHAY
jgi:hypothetical protein